MHDVGIDAVGQRHASYKRAALPALLNDLCLELWAVESSFGAIGVSLARHGVQIFIVHTISETQLRFKMCCLLAYPNY